MKFLLLSIIIAFSHFSFAFDMSGAQVCSSKAPRCPAGKKVFTIPGFSACLCVDSGIGTSCPAGTTLDKRPKLAFKNSGIRCGNLEYVTKIGGTYCGHHDVRENAPKCSGPLLKENNRNLRICYTSIGVKNENVTPFNGRTKQPRGHEYYNLHVPCGNRSERECQDLLYKMQNGIITIAQYGYRSPGKNRARIWCHDYTGSSVKYYPANRPEKECILRLVNRVTGADEGTLKFYANDGDKGYKFLARDTHVLSDLQALAASVKPDNVCDCNNGDYEFDLGESGSCVCPDGTPKPVNGECTGNCPADCPLIDNQCTCEEPCPPNPCGGNYTYTIAPTDPAPSRPSTAPAPTSQQCQCTSDKCPNEPKWNTNKPSNSPKHPNVTGPITGTGNINDSDKRCPDGGVLKDASLPTAYCERDQICSSVTDEQSCQSQTKPTDYGSCTVVGGGVNTVCIDGGTAAIYPANPDGTCTQGWAVHIGSDYKGSCNPAVSNDPSTSWDCSHHPGSLPVATEIPGDHVDGTGNFSCSCMGTGGTTEYICPNGVPSAQAPGCTCQTSVTENGCGHLTNYVREISGGGSTCDCPDSSWTKNSSTGVCSKTATGSSITTPLVMTSLPGSQTLSTPVGTMTTTSELIADGWTCNPIALVPSPDPTTICSKTVTSKICTDGGTYDSGTDKCEMSCVAAQTASSCKCVQENDTCRCGVGWTQVGNKCRRDALASSSVKCTCECYAPEQLKDLPFDVGSSTAREIVDDLLANPSNPTVCVEYDSGAPCGTKCRGDIGCAPPCCQINVDPKIFHINCPVPDPEAHADYDPGGCGKCPDGNIKPPSPGGCCANGKAVTNLNQCPQSASAGGDPKGIDIAFGGQGTAHFYSVYSTGSMNRPDHICWRRNTNGTTKVQERELMCPPKDDCGGGVRDSITGSCQCQSLNISDENISQPETYCEYGSRDPMRFEDGIIRGDVPSSRQNDKYETDIRFFKTNQIVTP